MSDIRIEIETGRAVMLSARYHSRSRLVAKLGVVLALVALLSKVADFALGGIGFEIGAAYYYLAAVGWQRRANRLTARAIGRR